MPSSEGHATVLSAAQEAMPHEIAWLYTVQKKSRYFILRRNIELFDYIVCIALMHIVLQ